MKPKVKEILATRLFSVAFWVLTVCLLLVGTSVVAGPKLRQLFYSFDASNGLADNSAQTIKCTRAGRMVVTTIGHINFYDGDSFTHIDPSPDVIFPLPKYNGHYHLYFDVHHHLWLKDRGSVTCVDLLTERFIQNVDSVVKSLGVQGRVDDLFSDIDSQLWMMTGGKLYGVDCKKAFPIRLKEELQDVDVYRRQVLLEFFANGVVSGYDVKSGRHLYDVAALDSTEAGQYKNSSVVLADSNLYYQIRNGEKDALLLVFNAETRQWKKLMTVPYHLNNMTRNRYKLYIASEYGYWTYNVNTGATEHVEELMLTKDRKLATDINAICFDRQGGMWLGTERRGLLYARPFKIPFVAFSWNEPEASELYDLMEKELPPQRPLPRHVNCEYTDSRGWTWTGTYTGLILTKRDGKEQVFTRKDGLPNEMVRSVVEGAKHNMWVATSFGIAHLYIRGDSVWHIESYTNRDNLPRESFVNGRAARLDDGTIVMQSLDHMVAFHGSNFYEREVAAMRLYPKLVRLQVNGYFLEAGKEYEGRVILDRAITRTSEVTVNYDQNSLLLIFSGMNYMRPEQTYYKVRVKGVFDDWRVLSYGKNRGQVDRNGLLRLPLTSLKPGDYTVELQASLAPDSWPVEPAKWVIHVEQPWWRSTGVYILLGLLLTGLLLANFYYFNHNIRLRYRRYSMEESLLRHIKGYAEQCSMLENEMDAVNTSVLDDYDAHSSETDKLFDEAMMKLVTYLHKHQGERISMRQMIQVSGLQAEQFYDVMSVNIHKTPIMLAMKLKQREG